MSILSFMVRDCHSALEAMTFSAKADIKAEQILIKQDTLTQLNVM